MKEIETRRKQWNQQQKELRSALENPGQHQKALELFLSQHAALHSSEVSQPGTWTFADELWQDLSENVARRISRNCEHSIVWNLWHLARIEDVTMNVLLAGGPQIMVQGEWLPRLGVTARDTGNAMNPQEIVQLSATLDIPALRAYRVAVGRGTRQIVRQLEPDELPQKVDPARLQRLLDEGAVVQEARGLIDYWSKRTLSGLLLMPPTRHNMVHLNESLRLKQRRR